jgi:hypothetical protein
VERDLLLAEEPLDANTVLEERDLSAAKEKIQSIEDIKFIFN